VSGVPKSFDVEIYYVRESDDDEPNWCQDESMPDYRSYKIGCTEKITSENHKCISPGIDNSYDLAISLDEHCCDGDDVLFSTGSDFNKTHYVLAGPNKSCDTDIILPADNGIPIGYSQEKIEETMEEVISYYEKFLIKLNPIYKGEVFYNFDTEVEDGTMSHRERNRFHFEYGDSNKSSLYIIGESYFPDEPTALGIGLNNSSPVCERVKYMLYFKRNY